MRSSFRATWRSTGGTCSPSQLGIGGWGRAGWEGRSCWAMAAAGQCSAVQRSAESRAVRRAARCSSGKAGLLPPVSSQRLGLSDFAALCWIRNEKTELGRKKQQKALKRQLMFPPLYGESRLPVWKAERQWKRPVSKGTTVANSFVWSLANVYASHFEVSDNCTLVQMSSRNRLDETEHL